MAAENSRVMDRMLSREIKPILLLPPASPFCVTSPSSTATSMLAVMSIPHRMLNTPPPSAQKRPRGLWKGRRLPADSTKVARNTHDDSPNLTDEDDNRCDTTTLTEVCYDDDLDDARSSSSSSSKRRRVSGGFSDYSCHSGSASRALSPELCHAPNALKSFSVGSMGDSTRLTARTTSTSSSGRPNPSNSDLEDWDNLKALFAKATDLCENESLEALPFLRAVIRECTRILTKHADPSIIFTGRQNQQSNYSPVQVVTPTEERLHRDWGNETFEAALRTNIMKSKRPASRSEDLPTALHAIFGIALFYMGNIIAQDPSLVLPGEPSSAVTYWLAALDVFETGESLPCFIDGHGSNETNEDWRMAISWGRTLVSLADEKVNSVQRARAEAEARAGAGVPAKAFPSSWSHMSTPGPFSLAEPTWPKDSPFYTIAVSRPPVTRRMSMYSATAHDILVLATDQFSRGIFHMPHPHHSYTPHPPHAAAFSTSPFERSPPPLLSPELSTSSSGSSTATSYFLPQHGNTHHSRIPSFPPSFSRPKELFTIASDVLGVAERLTSPSNREHWAKWADSVFNQMKMEADIGIWRGPVTRARGRCWLIVGSARAEEFEDALERGETGVLRGEDADDAREALTHAITFFERAKGSATTAMEEDAEDVSPLLAEALVTLANLTVDENKREELYARAQVEGGQEMALELQMLGLGPPGLDTLCSPSDTVLMDTS